MTAKTVASAGVDYEALHRKYREPTTNESWQESGAEPDFRPQIVGLLL